MILKPLAQIFFFGLNQISPPTQNHTVKNNGFWVLMMLPKYIGPHCNDALNKINEPNEPMINSSKWML